MAEKFFETYLKIKEELIADNLAIRPDPAMVLVYYLYRYTDIREPRAIHTLLNISLDSVINKLVKFGFLELPSKEFSIFRQERKQERVVFKKPVPESESESEPEVKVKPRPEIPAPLPVASIPVIKAKIKESHESEDVNDILKDFIIQD